MSERTKVIAQKNVTNVAALELVLAEFKELADTHGTEILFSQGFVSLTLVEETLSDGSKVFNADVKAGQ